MLNGKWRPITQGAEWRTVNAALAKLSKRHHFAIDPASIRNLHNMATGYGRDYKEFDQSVGGARNDDKQNKNGPVSNVSKKPRTALTEWELDEVAVQKKDRRPGIALCATDAVLHHVVPAGTAIDIQMYCFSFVALPGGTSHWGGSNVSVSELHA